MNNEQVADMSEERFDQLMVQAERGETLVCSGLWTLSLYSPQEEPESRELLCFTMPPRMVTLPLLLDCWTERLT